MYMINSTKYASNKKTQVLGYKYGRFRGYVAKSRGIPHGILLWVWDGYGDLNPIPTAALYTTITITSYKGRDYR